MLKRIGLLFAVVISLVIYTGISVAQGFSVTLTPSSGKAGTTVSVHTASGAECGVGRGPDFQFVATSTVTITCTLNGQSASATFTLKGDATDTPTPIPPGVTPPTPIPPGVTPPTPIPTRYIEPTPPCAAGLPDYVGQGYKRVDYACRDQINVLADADDGFIETYVPNIAFIRDQCPEYQPEFISLLYTLYRLNPGQGSDILTAINQALTPENACEFARKLIQHDGLPDDFPSQYMKQTLPLACNIRLSDERYDAILSELGSIDLRPLDVNYVNICHLIDTVNQLGKLQGDQKALYDYLLGTCLEDPVAALDNVFKAVSLGIEPDDLRDELGKDGGCSKLSDLFVKLGRTDYPEGTNSHFIDHQCDVSSIWILMTNYWPTLSPIQQQWLANNPFPCAAVNHLLTTGQIRSVEVSKQDAAKPEAKVVAVENPPPVTPVPGMTETVPPPTATPSGIGGVCHQIDKLDYDSSGAAVFLGHLQGYEYNDVYVLRAGKCEQLTSTWGVNESSPSLNWDGDTLAYLILDKDGKPTSLRVREYIQNPKEELILWERGDQDEWTIADYPPAWSKDGSHLLVTIENQQGNTAIQQINYNGKSYTAAIRDTSALIKGGVAPAFAPNGLYFAYERIKNNEKHIYVSVFDPPGIGEDYSPSGKNCERPTFLADSLRLFFGCKNEANEWTYYIYPEKVTPPDFNLNAKDVTTSVREDGNPALGISLGYVAEIEDTVIHFGPLGDESKRPVLIRNAGIEVTAFRWGGVAQLVPDISTQAASR